MENSERENLKEQLRAMAAGRGEGIDLNSKERWVIEGITDPLTFFRELNRLVPPGSILYFEGCAIAPDVAQFYQAHRSPDPVDVARDTIFPIPEMFHVRMDDVTLGALIDLIEKRSLEACFHHVKAYRDGSLLFSFHDAFDGADLLVSDSIPENAVRSFASSLGAAVRREANLNRRDPEQLQRILRALENPDQIKMIWPWWKKMLFFWKR